MEVFHSEEIFYCAGCSINYQNEKEYKEHYKTDLHRYNLKRKLISLPPVTKEEFSSKKQQISKQKKNDSKIISSVTKNKCEVCNKAFQNTQTYTQHLSSKKHKDQERFQQSQQASSQDVQSIQTINCNNIKYLKQDQKYEAKYCLFCDKDNDDIEGNLRHMSVVHGFFISEKEYLADTSGLLKYLNEKITEGLLCLYCENKKTKDFKTPQAVKDHMMDKGHCFMNTDQFEEYIEYYDFTSQFEEAKKMQENQKFSKNLKQEIIEIVSDDNDEEWESEDEGNENDDENDESDQEDNKKQQKQQAMPIKQQKKTIQKSEKNENKRENDGQDEEWESEEDENEPSKPKTLEKIKEEKLKKYKIHRLKIYKATVNALGELELPNGKILGHRKYKNYYKMYYRSMNTDAKIKQIMGEENYNEKKNQLMKMEFSQSMVKAYQNLKYVKNIEKSTKKEMHRQKIQFLKLGLKNIQHHFRIQNPIC